jgi:hypothetical protein
VLLSGIFVEPNFPASGPGEAVIHLLFYIEVYVRLMYLTLLPSAGIEFKYCMDFNNKTFSCYSVVRDGK